MFNLVCTDAQGEQLNNIIARNKTQIGGTEQEDKLPIEILLHVFSHCRGEIPLISATQDFELMRF